MPFTSRFGGFLYDRGGGWPGGKFPYQAVYQLRRSGRQFYAPEIVAKTGWTTDELSAAMQVMPFLPVYDFITLLIGVNDQYRGRPVAGFRSKFEELLKSALRLAGARVSTGEDLQAGFRQTTGRAFVLSIPDWGVTPFAKAKFPGLEHDRLARISGEIDAYNAEAQGICDSCAVDFIDITEPGRRLEGEPSEYTGDGLHPASGQLKT